MWGLQFVLLKIATDTGLGEIRILAFSLILLAVGFLAAMVVSGARYRPTWRHLRYFAVSGLLSFVIPLGGVILAARDISAGIIVLIEAMTPVFTIALALAWRTEAVSYRHTASVLLGFLGILCLLVPALLAPEHGNLRGLGFALIVPIAYACDGIYIAARWPGDIRPLQVVAGVATAGACMTLPFLIIEDGADPLFESWTSGHGTVVLFVLVSLLEVYLYFYLLRRAGAVFVSLASFISLFAGIVFGMVLIGESHAKSVWLAVAFATLALYFALSPRRPPTSLVNEPKR